MPHSSLKREDVMLLFKLVNEFLKDIAYHYSQLLPYRMAGNLGEEAVAAALLDRPFYCCEIIQLSRNSYGWEKQGKTIF